MDTNRVPRMVHEHYVRRVGEVMAARRERLAALRTRADAEAYVRRCRAAVRKCFGPSPARTPLKPVVTGRDEHRHYALEKVLFESRPHLLVTGDLYLPKGARRRSPAVLGLCGHSIDGKACDAYQAFCQGLAGKGFVVFVIDPIDQGERAQYYPKEGFPPGADGRGVCRNCDGHNDTGNQMVLVGDFFGAWRAWDAVRALDYLLARPEVDRRRVGVTGNSGGGTLTTYVAALDPRPTMVAPSCFVCSYRSNLECELPADAEQNPPGILAAGLDHADMLLCHAPRPTLVLSQYDDFFSEAFARAAAADVRRVCGLLGAAASAECFVGPRGHGYHIENRWAMYAFFLKHAGLEAVATEPKVHVVPESGLFATKTGETYRAGSRRAFEFTAERAAELAGRRPRLGERQLVAAARKLLGMPKASGVPAYRTLMNSWNFGKPPEQLFQYAVETEEGVRAILTTYGPRQRMMHPPTGRVTLYVGHVCGQEDVANIPELRKCSRSRERALVVCDPRGIGQSAARTCGSVDFFDLYGSDYLYAAQGEMLGESYLGRRVFDVLRVVDLLAAKGARPVDLLGRGLGSVIVAFAALLHPARPRARVFHYLPSYELVARTPGSTWPLSSLLRGVLKRFDLPDVYRALGRRLTKDRPWGARMQPLRGRSPANRPGPTR